MRLVTAHCTVSHEASTKRHTQDQRCASSLHTALSHTKALPTDTHRICEAPRHCTLHCLTRRASLGDIFEIGLIGKKYKK